MSVRQVTFSATLQPGAASAVPADCALYTYRAEKPGSARRHESPTRPCGKAIRETAAAHAEMPRRIFPSAKPSGRSDALMLMHAIKQMLLARAAPTLDDLLAVEAYASSADVLKAMQQDFRVWDTALAELARQSMAGCAERGACMSLVRCKVARLFESLQQLETRRTELCLHGLMQTMQAAAESREHELFQELAEVQDENQALRDEMEDLKRELEAFQQRPDTASSSAGGGAPIVLQRQQSVVKAQRNTGGRRRSSVLTGNMLSLIHI